LLLAVAPISLLGQTGQQLFESTCAGCHGLDGKGGEHAPNIVTSSKVRNLPDSALNHIVQDGIPASGMPAFGSVFNPSQIGGLVSYLRILQGTQKPARIFGDAEAGRTLFEEKARCAKCHNINGKGGFLASDLSGYGKTHAPDEVHQQILNHNGDEHRAITRVVTRQGRVYEGLLRNEDNFSIQLQTFNGDFLFVRRIDLTVVEHKELSILLANDGVKLDADNLDNLISYLSRTPGTQSSEKAAAPKTPPK
jgi:cytochrome c oxidase cbb3-type subunit 3